MKVTWLGQAGLLFDNGQAKVMIDPYLSNSVVKVNPKNYRRIPINESLFDIEPDVMIFTHDHLDHYDPETAEKFLAGKNKAVTVLCPTSVWQKVRLLGGGHNYVELNRNTEWSENGYRFTAVRAVHSDPYAIGVLVESVDEKKTYYITGDTLYNKDVLCDIPSNTDAVFLPINGVGNNMNAVDAARFARACGAKKVIPIHVGMFDELSPEMLEAENKVILRLYAETEV